MRLLILGGLVVAVACEKPAAPADPTGTIAVSWSGATKGRLEATGEARWCASDSLLEILGVDGDTGFGLSLLVPDSIRAVQYPVISGSVKADWRPLGVAGLRIASDTAVKGYEATGGNIALTAVSTGTVTGTIDVKLKVIQGEDTLRLSGVFTAIPVRPFTTPCGRMSKVRGR